MASVFYPQPAFSFRVVIDGAGGDASFQEVTGLKATLETQNLNEGGQNRFTHRLPLRTSYANLFLKRGLVTGASALATWLTGTFALGPAQRLDLRTILVQLLDANANPSVQWKVVGAYPVGWDHTPLDAMGDALMIETAEFAYQYFDRTTYAFAGAAGAA